MKIPINDSLDLVPQLTLYVKLQRDEGRPDAEIIDDLIDTIPDPEDEYQDCLQDSYNQGYSEGYEAGSCVESPAIDLSEDVPNKFLATINKFRCALSHDHPAELNHRDYGLRRSAAIYKLINIHSLNSVYHLEKCIKELGEAFGAPGRYGYDTPAGDSLRDIYETSQEEIEEYLKFMNPPKDSESITPADKIINHSSS